MGAHIDAKDVAILLKLAKAVAEDVDASKDAKELAAKVQSTLGPPDTSDIKSGLIPPQSGPNLDPRSKEGRDNLRKK
jgi:hypothetical protein